MKRIYIFSILLFLFSVNALCQARVKLVYGAKGVLVPIAVECNPESFERSFSESLNFLTTYDDIFIAWFSFYIGKLVPENDTMKIIDPRIMIISYNESLQNDTLYLGESYGILKNGTMMKDSKELLNLVKRKIGWDMFTPLASDSLLYPPAELP